MHAPAAPQPAAPQPAAPQPGAGAAAYGAFLQSVTHLQGAGDLEAAGEEALRSGDYVAAIRHFGAALRRLRGGD